MAGTVADLQGDLNLIFVRARSLWKESAARLHPELQVAGYKLLSFIDRAGTANAHQLAERFEMDKSVISRQVRMLEDFGLLESRADERDGRLRVLTATPRASAQLSRLRAEYAARLRDGMGEVTEEEILAASKVFRLLAEV
ncbi:MarR family winged helix-turn-helix transcriptional regulator [Microbacterium oryzae]|nr:MarR family transcriptional regulator [Microbacterium oryzae]